MAMISQNLVIFFIRLRLRWSALALRVAVQEPAFAAQPITFRFHPLVSVFVNGPASSPEGTAGAVFLIEIVTNENGVVLLVHLGAAHPWQSDALVLGGLPALRKGESTEVVIICHHLSPVV